MSDLGAAPETLNMSLRRGDTLPPVTLTFASAVDVNNVPTDVLDVSGWDISAQVRSYPNAPTVLVQLEVDETDSVSGVVVLNLSAEDSATLPARTLVWDCQRTNPDVETFWQGTFTVGADVTRLDVP